MRQEFTLIGGVDHRIEVVLAHFVAFGLLGNGGHGLHRLEGIFARGRFAAEHEGIGAIVDGVGDVGDLCSRGTRVVDHRVKHLRGHDHRFFLHHTLVNDLALDAGDAFDGHFDAEVAARDHDAIGGVDDLVDVVHAFLVFDFRNDLDVAAVCVENVLHSLDIGGVAHEGVGDEVDVFFDGQEDVGLVSLGECGQIDVFAGHVHALVRAEHAVILHRDVQGLVFRRDKHVDGPVVEEHMVAHLHVAHEVGIRYIDDIVRGVAIRTTIDAHFFAGFVFEGGCQSGGAHFGTLRVDEQTEVGRNGTDVANDFLDAVGRGVGGVHAHHVHAGEKQLAEEIFVAAQIADRADDLGLFHYWEISCTRSVVFARRIYEKNYGLSDTTSRFSAETRELFQVVICSLQFLLPQSLFVGIALRGRKP